MTFLLRSLLVALTVTLASCGGGSDASFDNGGERLLRSIGITPNPLALTIGETGSLTATGTFTDGSTEDLTTRVSWASSDVTLPVNPV